MLKLLLILTISLVPRVSWATIAVVQSVSAQVNTGVSLTTGDLTTSTGTLIICDTSYYLSGNSFVSITDSKANTYQSAIAETQASGDTEARFQQRFAPGPTVGAGHNFTITLSGAAASTAMTIVCKEVSDSLTTAAVLDRTSIKADNTGTSYTSNSTAATSQANELLSGGCAVPGSGNETTFTATGAFTEDQEKTHCPGGCGVSDSTGIMSARLVVSSVGSYAMTCTISASTGSGGISWISTWKEDVGATAVARPPRKVMILE